MNSIKSSITKVTVIRVEVQVPDRAFTLFHDSVEYQQAVIKACEGNVSAGSDYFSTAFEWAEFHTMAEALTCERRLRDVMHRYAERAAAYDAENKEH